MTETTQDKMSYRKVLEGLLRMHELSTAGQHETDKIKQLRDAIDEPYSDLSAEAREIIEGLSTDLFDVENITSEPVLDHVPEGDHAMAVAIHAQNSGKDDEALKLLRQCKSKPASRIAFLRGRIWSEMGEPKIALLFFNHAAKLDPGNDESRAQGS
jgi:hypothetical protein